MCQSFQWQDPGFPRGGGADSPGGCQHTILPNFPKKLHEIERIWVPGGHAPLAPPLRSATAFCLQGYVFMNVCLCMMSLPVWLPGTIFFGGSLSLVPCSFRESLYRVSLSRRSMSRGLCPGSLCQGPPPPAPRTVKGRYASYENFYTVLRILDHCKMFTDTDSGLVSRFYKVSFVITCLRIIITNKVIKALRTKRVTK